MRLSGLSLFSYRIRFQEFASEDIEPQEELLSANGYMVHSAKVKGRVAIVKVFHGPVAAEVRWK